MEITDKKTPPLRLKLFWMTVCATVMVSVHNVVMASEAPLDVVKPPSLKDRPLNEYVQADHFSPTDSRTVRDFDEHYTNDIGDGFFFAPGVWVNRLDIHEPRIVVRGYGASNGLERSSTPMLRDGAPLSDVHGTVNVQEIDLLAVKQIDIYRGGSGDLRFVGDSLGGAINFISPTGLDHPSGLVLRGDGGASIEGTPGGRLHGSVAGAGAVDYYLSFTSLYETGFRDNNERNSFLLNANFGYQLSNSIFTRFYVSALKSKTELAGGLFPADVLDDPSQAVGPIGLGPLFPGGPLISFTDGAEEDNFGRDIISAHVSNATTFRFLAHDVEIGGHYARRYIDSPQIDFIGVVDEDASEWGARLYASRDINLFGLNTFYRLGANYSTGLQTSDRFENLSGVKGDQEIDTEQKSTNLNAFLDILLKPFKGLMVDMGAKFIMVDRELSVDEGEFEEARYIGVAAKAGLAYNIWKNVQFVASAARTYEPPSFNELIADSPTDLAGLEEQDAFTYEAGLRGKPADWISWDVKYFSSSIENEIINIDDPQTNGLGAVLVNADSTSHKGIEAGVDILLFQNSMARHGNALTLRSAYSYNNFRFTEAGPIGGIEGNRIAGVPEHVYRGELRYDSSSKWFAAVNVQIAGGEYFADHENVTSVPTHTLVGFSAGWRPNEAMEFFVSGENLTDQVYAAGVIPVTSQATQNARIFTPGERASVYGGLRYRF